MSAFKYDRVSMALFRTKVEKELHKRTHDLSKRVKELNCLHGVSTLVEKFGISLDGILQGMVELIPPSWQYPEVTCARIAVEDKIYKTTNFKETIWKQANDIFVQGNRIGNLEVYYLEEKPEEDEGVFLKEERNLINSITERLGKIIEHKRVEKKSREAEQETREARDSFENIFRTTVDGILVVNAVGVITRVNRALEKMFGYSSDELIGKYPAELSPLDSEDYECGIKYTTKLFEEGAVIGEEFNWLKKDGSIINIELNATLLKDKEGNLLGSLASIREITHRIKAEKEIKEAKDFLESVIESSKDGILIVDERGNILSCNTAMEKISGFNKEELVGTHASSLVVEDKEIRKYLREKAAELYEKGSATYEATYATKDGKSVVVDCTSSMIKNEKGDYIAGVSVLRDITERKKAEKEIKETRDFLERIIESSKDGIVVTDEKGIITSVNTAIEQMCSFRKEELIGKHTSELVIEDKDVRKKILMKIAELSEKGYTTYETIHKKKGGSTITVECNTSVIKDINGNSVAGVSIIRDITERKEIEQKLLQSEKLRSLGELAGGVAHDFNNALAAILGRAQLLRMNVEPPPGKKERRESVDATKKGLEVIERAAKDGAETVRRIQEFARRRDDDKYFTTIDLNEVIDNALEFTRIKWKDETESKGIRIKIKKELSPLAPILGSSSELREVFPNLINNAIDAMPQGGEIRVESFMDDTIAVIRISDTGKGIPKDIKDRIFDPFFTTKDVQSTGLGLSVSYGIINRHRGTITVDSVEGEGTAFTIKFPITKKTGEGILKEEKVVPIKGKQQKASILVIEDEEDVRHLLRDILTDAGHNVEVANDGFKGVEMFKKKSFDLVFTDLGMPGMSGWEVAEKIKAINDRVPIALITGWNVELNINMSEMKDDWIDFVVQKPFEINQILKLVQEGMVLRDKIKAV